jgi:hypothetical protein
MIDARNPLLALLRGAVLLAILAIVSGCASPQASTGQVRPTAATKPDSAVTPRPTSSTFLSTCGELYTLQVAGQIVSIGQCAGTLSTHSAPRIAVRLGLTFTLAPVGGRWATDVGVPASDTPAVVSLKAVPTPTAPATYVAHRVGTATLSTVTAFCTDGPVRTAGVGGSPTQRECPVAVVVVTP